MHSQVDRDLRYCRRGNRTRLTTGTEHKFNSDHGYNEIFADPVDNEVSDQSKVDLQTDASVTRNEQQGEQGKEED